MLVHFQKTLIKRAFSRRAKSKRWTLFSIGISLGQINALDPSPDLVLQRCGCPGFC
jgi:hypothetical protein